MIVIIIAVHVDGRGARRTRTGSLMTDRWRGLRSLSHTTLSTEASLSTLYDVRGELHGVQSGQRRAVHKETGVHYAMRAYEHANITEKLATQLCAAISAQLRLCDAPADELPSVRLPRLHEVICSNRRTLLIQELAPAGGHVCTDLLTLIEAR